MTIVPSYEIRAESEAMLLRLATRYIHQFYPRAIVDVFVHERTANTFICDLLLYDLS
jgi:hypothetical protein